MGACMPPLAADGHRRGPAWRDALAVLLDASDLGTSPVSARIVMAVLRGRQFDAVDSLADGFPHGGVDAADAGAALYVATAPRVCFTRLPSSCQRHHCGHSPAACRGSTPVSGAMTDSGSSPGTRYLYSSLCGTAWNCVRATCTTCRQSRSLVPRGIEGDACTVRAETCDDCHAYAKNAVCPSMQTRVLTLTASSILRTSPRLPCGPRRITPESRNKNRVIYWIPGPGKRPGIETVPHREVGVLARHLAEE